MNMRCIREKMLEKVGGRVPYAYSDIDARLKRNNCAELLKEFFFFNVVSTEPIYLKIE